MNDVRERVQVWETNLVFINLHTAVMCCWLSSYCLLCVRSSANSLSSRKTVPHAHRACDTISLMWNGRHPLSFYQIYGSQQSRS